MEVLSTRSDEQLSQIIRVMVCGFKIIGLAPISLEQIKKSAKNSRSSYCTSVFLVSKIGFAYNILLSILFVVIGSFAIPRMLQIDYANRTPITQAIDSMQAVLRTSTCCVIIVFWSLRQKMAASIMNRLLEVDCLLSGMKTHLPSERTPFTFLAVHTFLDALLWVTFWATEKGYICSILDIFIFNVPIFVMHCFVVEYSIVVGLVARKLKTLNSHLLNFREFPYTSSPNDCPAVWQISSNNSQLSALKLLHSIRTTLSEVSQDIAAFFSLPVLPAVACFSLTLVYNLNYLIAPLVMTSGDIPIVTCINVAMWIVASIYPLVLLCFNVTETLKEAKQTGPMVHKLLATVRRQEIQTALERFALQVMHEDLSFTAYGFFPLDFTLIQSIFGATVTYIVIIMQFMQSAASTSKNPSA